MANLSVGDFELLAYNFVPRIERSPCYDAPYHASLHRGSSLGGRSLHVYAKAPVPVPLILDTDISNDIDDALALGLIHALESRGEVRLLAVTVTKDDSGLLPTSIWSIPSMAGPASHRHGSRRKNPENSDYLMKPAQKHDSGGRYIYPHRLLSGTDAQEAVSVLKQVLEKQEDRSVVIAQIGFSTNLARLLQSSGGTELVGRKVKLLALMGGNFEKADPEYNVYTDPAAAASCLLIGLRLWCSADSR